MQLLWALQVVAAPHVQGKMRNVQLMRMRQFQRGQETDVFRRRPQPMRAFLSFSILYLDE